MVQKRGDTVRYFFDLVGKGQLIYDYSGREVATPNAALELAELIALDCEVEDDWGGWRVAVRNASGKECFSVSVRDQQPIDDLAVSPRLPKLGGGFPGFDAGPVSERIQPGGWPELR